MKHYLIFIGLFLVTFWCQAQQTPTDTLLRHYYQYPREALQAATDMYKTAQAKHDTPLLIKSLILKTTFTLQINRDNYPQMLKETEEYISREKDIPAQCILHSYLGELYLQYYHQNQYNIRQRKAIQEEIPEDITEWSSNLFQEKILNHFSASLLPQKILQQTPVNDYKTILIHGNASDSLRPTLYDFLSHRAIDCLSANRYDFPSSLLNGNAEVLGDLQQFIQMPDTLSPLDVQSHILKFWQELLRFRQEARQENALLMADLERLNYGYGISNRTDKDSLYLQTLAAMREKYANTPMVVEVIATEVHLLLHLPTNTDLRFFQHRSTDLPKINREKALALCQTGIKQFPQYNRTNQLRNLLRCIQAPELQIESPQQLYPGEKFPIRIHFRTLSRLNIRLKKIHASSETYRNNNKKTLPATQIQATSCRLPYDLQQQDTTIYLSVPETGLYEVTFKIPDIKDSIKQSFICSRLFCALQNSPQQRNFQVNDWKTGQPVKNAKILIYKERYPQTIPVDSVFTDAKGWATYQKYKKRDLWYQVVDRSNPNGHISYAFMPYASEKTQDRMSLITDRSIYKPGQTVYFQGIYWRATTDTLYPLTKKRINIQLRDSKDNMISELKVFSDSFGSFSGNFLLPEQVLNGTFRLTSDLGGERLIQVEEYKHPEFDITFQQPRQTFYIGDTIRINGQVKSFSGIALSNQEIRYDISSFSWARRFAPNNDVLQGITTTDQEGNFSITFKAQPQTGIQKYSFPLNYNINAKVTDSKGETQESRYQVTAFPGTATPVLSVPQQVNKADSTPFIIQLEHLPSHAHAQTIRYAIYQLKTPVTLLTNLQMQDTTVTRTVLQGTLQMAQKDTLFPDLSAEPSGAYLFSVKHGDIETKEIFYLYSLYDQKPPVPTYTWLIAQKTECFPGDTARIRFGTSVQNAYILYEIYNENKLIRRNYTNLSDGIMTIDIPYLAEYGKSIRLTIFYVKDKKDFQQTVQINQLERNRTLDIQTLTFRDHLVPGQQEEWKIRILNEDGQAVPTQAVAFMYDASLDKLHRYSIDFQPARLAPRFSYDWGIPYFYQEHTHDRLYYTIPGMRKYPDFQFDKLNTFPYRYSYSRSAATGSNMKETLELADFDDAEESTLYYVGAAPKAMNKLSRTQSSTNADNGKAGISSDDILYRTDFQETAFFYPQLQTDSTGELNIRFKVPQSLTRWKLNILAYTRQLAHGTLTRYITTSKPLMVRPNLPRFFRSGDHTILKVTVSNLTDSLQQGTAGVELFLPGNQKILLKQTANFRIDGKENKTLDFALKIPEDIDLAGCRIFAGNKTFNDGEQHLLPVLPNEVLLTETQPIYATQAGPHTYTLSPSSSSRKNYRLTLELSAAPVWYAVLALPTLSEPQQENATDISASFYVNTIAHKIARSNPAIVAAIRQWKNTPGTPTLLSQLERNAELKSILLNASPWMLEAENETEQMQRLAELFDENRLHYLQEKTLDQLKKLQNNDGGWSWFKGMYSSRFMTANVLTILARSTTVGEFQPDAAVKQMQIKALRYLDKEITDDLKNKNHPIHYDQLLYLYTRSFYRDIPLGDALKAHKYYMEQTQKQWPGFSLYEKAIAAVALNNYGFRNESRKILESLRQYAVTTPEDGMYWPNNRNQYYRNSAVQVHTAIMEAFTLIEGDTAEINLMNQWLLRQKQVQNWGSVPSTVDAIYTLLLTGNDLLTAKEQLNVRIGKHELSVSAENNPVGYLKKSYSSNEIRPDMLTVKMDKQTDTPSWGGLYLQYFEKLDRVKKQKTDISVDKKLYIEQTNSQGKAELLSLDKHPLKVGDKVIVRLTVTLNRDMEFLHLKDLRAACFEPAEALSGNRWKFGTVYYQETKDAATNFFFNALSRGTYVLEYPVWVNQTGTYQDGMATFQSIYAPEYNAHSTTRQIQVKP